MQGFVQIPAAIASPGDFINPLRVAGSQVPASTEYRSNTADEPRVQVPLQAPADGTGIRGSRSRPQASSGSKKSVEKVIKSFLLNGSAEYKGVQITGSCQLAALFSKEVREGVEKKLFQNIEYKKELIGVHYEWDKCPIRGNWRLRPILRPEEEEKRRDAITNLKI